jgi:hypothetical protein
MRIVIKSIARNLQPRTAGIAAVSIGDATAAPLLRRALPQGDGPCVECRDADR